jgi:hypothetical protein
MSTWKVTNDMVDSLSSSKLTGALPAIDGSNLTGVSGFPDTTSANDPATNTNPAGGVGTVWTNSTSGETYVCTDATTDANVWTNVGAGDGNITPYTPGSFGGQGGGQNFGYHCGGLYPQVTNIQGKYSYASDGDSTGVASMMMQGYAGSGCQSPTAGFSFGFDGAPATGQGQKVEKHVFASNTQSHCASGADLALWHLQLCTATNSITHGYTLGGGWNGAPGTGHANYGNIQKLSFATETTMTFVGDAYNHNNSHVSLVAGAGAASNTHAYRAAGHGGPQTSSIEKWSFASDGNSAFVASMVRGNDTGCSGGSSGYHGYIMGGHAPSIIAPIVGRGGYSKYSFVSDADSTTVGSLFHPDSYSSGTSSTTHCYMAGGGHPQVNVIQKGSFASDGNTTDVGNIIQARAYVHGYQN